MEEQNTTNPTVANTPVYAGFWLRFVAIIIDGIILSAAKWIIIGPIIALFGLKTAAIAENPSGANAVSWIIAMLVASIYITFIMMIIYWLYFALMESSSKQATIGKMALGLKVTDLNGEKISFARASGRYFGKIISGMILFIGYMMAGFTAKKQALHDIMSDCLVVKK